MNSRGEGGTGNITPFKTSFIGPNFRFLPGAPLSTLRKKLIELRLGYDIFLFFTQSPTMVLYKVFLGVLTFISPAFASFYFSPPSTAELLFLIASVEGALYLLGVFSLLSSAFTEKSTHWRHSGVAVSAWV